MRLVARLGGFFARKGDGAPSVMTIWPGWRRVIDCAGDPQFMRKVAAG
ncbi:MAG: hypothetical protein JNK99_08910 [Candidatus Accumulibacter sp.]|nr:hypothetical protein [Accumulibacter sp.]